MNLRHLFIFFCVAAGVQPALASSPDREMDEVYTRAYRARVVAMQKAILLDVHSFLPPLETLTGIARVEDVRFQWTPMKDEYSCFWNTLSGKFVFPEHDRSIPFKYYFMISTSSQLNLLSPNEVGKCEGHNITGPRPRSILPGVAQFTLKFGYLQTKTDLRLGMIDATLNSSMRARLRQYRSGLPLWFMSKEDVAKELAKRNKKARAEQRQDVVISLLNCGATGLSQSLEGGRQYALLDDVTGTFLERGKKVPLHFTTEGTGDDSILHIIMRLHLVDTEGLASWRAVEDLRTLSAQTMGSIFGFLRDYTDAAQYDAALKEPANN